MFTKRPLFDDDFALLAEILQETPPPPTEDMVALKTMYDSLEVLKWYLSFALNGFTSVHNNRVHKGRPGDVPIYDSFTLHAVGSDPPKCDWPSMLKLLNSVLQVKDLDLPWSLQDLKEAASDVEQKLGCLKVAKKEWSKLLGIEDTFIEYENVGSKLLETAEVQKFIELVFDIQKRNKDSTLVPAFRGKFMMKTFKPSIMICSSSGTGKTQLPFALSHKYPLLYLHDMVEGGAVNKWQNIYLDFEKISLAFHKCCLKDKKILQSHPGLIEAIRELIASGEEFPFSAEDYSSDSEVPPSGDKVEAITQGQEIPFGAEERANLLNELDHQNYWYGMHIMVLARRLNIKLRSVSFLEIVLSRMHMIKMRSSNSWLDCELNIEIPTLKECRPKSITECGDKIREMFEGDEWMPIVFIDECRTGNRQFMYAFKRNIIRVLNLIPVVMGTDTRIRNVVSTFIDAAIASRQWGDAWCFVFSDLPQYSKTLIKSDCDELRNQLSEAGQLPNAEGRKKLVDVMEKVLVKERPLFVKLSIEELGKRILDRAVSLEDILQFVFSFVFKEYRGVKTVTQEFLHSQAYFAQKNYPCVNGRERSKIGCNTIHRHLGYFQYPQDAELEKQCRGVLTLVVNNQRKLRYVALNRKFVKISPLSKFASFKDQPITHLAFLSSHRNFLRPNLPNSSENSRRRSALDVADVVKMGLKDTLSMNNLRDGSHLQTLVKCSLVFSMSMNGFKGQSAVEWLPWFASEYSSAYTSFEFVYETEELKTALSKIDLPFIGREDEEWNTDFKEFIEEYCAAYLGLLRATSNPKGMECRILDLNDRTRTVLRLDCKNWGENVSKTDLTKIFWKFIREQCRLNLVVAYTFEDYAAMPAVFHKHEIEENDIKVEKSFDDRDIVVLRVEMMAPPQKRTRKGLKQVMIKILYGKMTADCRFFLLWPIEFFEDL